MTKPSVQVSKWKKLVSWIYDELHPDSREKIMFGYQQDSMNVDHESERSPQMRFFDAVDNTDIGELDSARELKEQIQLLNLHTDFGESLVEKVDECIRYLEDQRGQLEVLTDSRFIGRSSELKLVYDKIEDTNIKCVCICGLGGQGKTYLARKVLWLSKQERPDMAVVRVDLRNIERTIDVIKSMLSQSPNCPNFGGNSDQNEMENILKQYLLNSNQRIMYYLDDCDSVLQNDRPVFGHFIKVLLDFLCGCKVWVKIMVTVRVRLSSVYRDDRVAEIELLELEKEDAIQMFQKYSGMEQIDERIVNEIVTECAYSPLAISMMADLVRSGKFTPEHLTFHLKMDKKNVTAQMRVGKCIQESVGNLQPIHLQALVGLSVFQSSSFNVSNAEKIIKKCLGNKVGDDGNVRPILQSLYDFHLLEAEDSGKVKPKTDQPRRKCRYSLHPLVSRYLSEWKKPKQLLQCYQDAVQQFVSICEKLIGKIVRLLESEHLKGQKKLDENRVHVLRYYDIMSDQADVLSPHMSKTTDRLLFQKKCVSDLADILLSLVKTRRMFQSEADRALKVKNNDVYIFWMVEKADAFVMLHDKPDIAMEILDQLSNRKFTALQRVDDRLFYKPMVHALFHKVKATIYWKQFNHQTALQHLDLCLRFYEKCPKPIHNMLISRVQCLQGVVFLDLGQLDSAELILNQALSSVKEVVRVNEQTPNTQASDVAGELHWDIPRFFTYFAKIKLKRAMAADDQAVKNQYLESALEDINHGMKLDKLLKLDKLDGYYAKLKLRADIYVEKGLLDEALHDANFASDQRREILQPPHTKFTESVYQVGRIYMLQGNDWMDKGNLDKAQKHWICASDYFAEVKDCHLKEGGMDLLCPVLQEIKRDHIALTKLLGKRDDLKRFERFYKEFEAGAYESEKKSSSKNIIQMLYTPMEMVKKMFGGGGASFGANEGKLARLESLTHEQQDRMRQGETSGGGRRRDSGMGHSSFEGDSLSSGSGSMSEHMAQLNLQKSLSIEDNVFAGPGESTSSPTSERRKQLKKRQRTIDD